MVRIPNEHQVQQQTSSTVLDETFSIETEAPNASESLNTSNSSLPTISQTYSLSASIDVETELADLEFSRKNYKKAVDICKRFVF